MQKTVTRKPLPYSRAPAAGAPEPGVAADATRPVQGATAPSKAGWAVFFLCTLILPFSFHLAGLRLTPYRLVLLLLFFPLLFRWLSGRAGRVLAADVLMAAYTLWNTLALVAVEGMGQVNFAGITAIETFGAYLVGRCLVRGPDDMDRVFRTLYVFMLIFVPATLYEAVSGTNLFIRVFDAVADVYPQVIYYRSGFLRAQGPFEHPILYGVFASTVFAPLMLWVNPATGRRYGLRRAWSAVAATFFSLSSGALLAVFVQIGLMMWNWVFRSMPGRWTLLLSLCGFAYVAVDLLSNRTPFEVFSSYLTFDPYTAYFRILIFQFGMENVWANPVFGLGLRDWVRPWWMHADSVDNFWLLSAMRYGIPSFFLIAATYLAVVAGIARRDPGSPRARNQRLALVFVLVSLAYALATVHLWNATYVYMMFLLGCGGWMREKRPAEDGTEPAAGPAGPRRAPPAVRAPAPTPTRRPDRQA